MLTYFFPAVTSTFALPLTAYFGLLSARVIAARKKDHVAFGDGSSSPTSSTKSASATAPSALLIASRSHGNFVEYVPLALLLAGMAELKGGSKRVLSAALGGLLAFRVIHTEFGLRVRGGTGKGRVVGFMGTMGVLGGLTGYAAWLGRGYWGF
ncbi:membrane-associated, eicosanoid/glutathione metabolism protein [Coniochaeta sp. 2T2.1]|nr:membrane-associated, eicosanoid/glutathione metabolism protein [Coniochaeta sp. 2T2.1]